jgi:hypothetical protein
VTTKAFFSRIEFRNLRSPFRMSDSAAIWLPEVFRSAGIRASYVRKQKTDKRHDVIAVWKIDRFGRSLKHLANVLAVTGAMSEFERSLLGSTFVPGSATWSLGVFALGVRNETRMPTRSFDYGRPALRGVKSRSR